jgi:hypothetical protein
MSAGPWFAAILLHSLHGADFARKASPCLTNRVTGQVAAPTARLRVTACACCDTVNCSFCTTEKVTTLNTFGDLIASPYGVHLGAKSGHVSGLRFGYSQIANLICLIRKGTVPPRFALELMGRNVLANLIRSVWPAPYIDGCGRLKGNLLAVSHLIRSRVTPEYILKL